MATTTSTPFVQLPAGCPPVACVDIGGTKVAVNVADAPPLRPKPLTQDGLLGLFDAETTGADFVLDPATDADMRGKYSAQVKSLEVVYDDV